MYDVDFLGQLRRHSIDSGFELLGDFQNFHLDFEFE